MSAHFLYLFLFLPMISLGQTLSDSLLATFYNLTLDNYFSDSVVYKEQEKFGCILLQTDFDTSLLLKNRGANEYKYLNSQTNKLDILNKPLKKNINRRIYSISHHVLNQDTVDLNIGYWIIEDVSIGVVNFSVLCAGTAGYTPDAKFIRDKETNSWRYTSPREKFEKGLKESPH